MVRPTISGRRKSSKDKGKMVFIIETPGYPPVEHRYSDFRRLMATLRHDLDPAVYASIPRMPAGGMFGTGVNLSAKRLDARQDGLQAILSHCAADAQISVIPAFTAFLGISSAPALDVAKGMLTKALPGGLGGGGGGSGTSGGDTPGEAAAKAATTAQRRARVASMLRGDESKFLDAERCFFGLGGIPMNKAKAGRLMGQLARAGAGATGLAAQGWCNFQGWNNLPCDKPKALRLWRRAAAMGSVSANYMIGNCYAWGDAGLTHDDGMAVRHWIGPATVGHADAQYYMGCYSLVGWGGLKKNRAAAIDWLKRSAAQGHPKALKKLDKLRATWAKRKAANGPGAAGADGGGAAAAAAGDVGGGEDGTGGDPSQDLPPPLPGPGIAPALEAQYVRAEAAFYGGTEPGAGTGGGTSTSTADSWIVRDTTAARTAMIAAAAAGHGVAAGWCDARAWGDVQRPVFDGSLAKAMAQWTEASTQLHHPGAKTQLALARLLRAGVHVDAMPDGSEASGRTPSPRTVAPAEAAAIVGLLSDAVEDRHAEGCRVLALLIHRGQCGQVRDTGRALVLMKTAADQGHAAALFVMFTAQRDGNWGFSPSVDAARPWLKKAARQGHAEAQYRLGMVLADEAAAAAGQDQGDDAAAEATTTTAMTSSTSTTRAGARRRLSSTSSVRCLGTAFGAAGVFSGPGPAVVLFRRAAAQGHVDAQYTLALALHAKGERAKDQKAAAEAVSLCTNLAAQHNHPGARGLLGLYHRNGAGGLARDMRAAVELWKMAAPTESTCGSTLSRVKLARLLLKGHSSATFSVPQDEAEALRLLASAAADGDVQAGLKREKVLTQMAVSDFDNVSKLDEANRCLFALHGRAKDMDRVSAIMVELAHRSPAHPTAVGFCHLYGWAGSDVDVSEAVAFLTLAAEAGEPMAMHELGKLLLKGDGGLGRDVHAARLWWQKAAQRGHAEACFRLGMQTQAVSKAAGSRKLSDSAQTFWREAARQGHLGARDALAKWAAPRATRLELDIEALGIANASAFVKPFLAVHVADKAGRELEPVRRAVATTDDATPGVLHFNFNQAMRTSINLMREKGASIIFELRHTKRKMRGFQSVQVESCRTWTFLNVDHIEERLESTNGRAVLPLYEKIAAGKGADFACQRLSPFDGAKTTGLRVTCRKFRVPLSMRA